MESNLSSRVIFVFDVKLFDNYILAANWVIQWCSIGFKASRVISRWLGIGHRLNFLYLDWQVSGVCKILNRVSSWQASPNWQCTLLWTIYSTKCVNKIFACWIHVSHIPIKDIEIIVLSNFAVILIDPSHDNRSKLVSLSFYRHLTCVFVMRTKLYSEKWKRLVGIGWSQFSIWKIPVNNI